MNNTGLKTFEYEMKQLRIVTVNNEPWFVGKDICEHFGDTNYRRSLSRLDEDEKGVSPIDTPGGRQNMLVVNESGLYSLLFLMQPQQANLLKEQYECRIKQIKTFRRWVTHEVLPAVRKTGLYATPEAAEKLLQDPDFLISALQELKVIRLKNAVLTETVSIQNQQIEEMRPKAGYYDVILACKDAVAITTIAKDYGKSGQWMNEYLHTLGVQFKQGSIWLLYQKYAKNGYTCTRTHPYIGADGERHSKVHTYWTQKGRLFIYELLKAHGYLPLIEQGTGFEVV